MKLFYEKKLKKNLLFFFPRNHTILIIRLKNLQNVNFSYFYEEISSTDRQILRKWICVLCKNTEIRLPGCRSPRCHVVLWAEGGAVD